MSKAFKKYVLKPLKSGEYTPLENEPFRSFEEARKNKRRAPSVPRKHTKSSFDEARKRKRRAPPPPGVRQSGSGRIRKRKCKRKKRNCKKRKSRKSKKVIKTKSWIPIL